MRSRPSGAGQWILTANGYCSAVLLSLIAALLMAATSLPFGWSGLFVIPLALLFYSWTQGGTRRGRLLRALLSGTLYFALDLIWLPLSFAKLFGPFGVVPFVFLWVLEGAFWAALLWVVELLQPAGPRKVWLLALGWVLLEWLKFLGPLAFPWAVVGGTLMPTPLIQVISLGGPLLASLLVTLMAAALVRAAQGAPAALGAMLLIWVAGLLYGALRPAPRGKLHTATLIQGNINPLRKVAGDGSALARYRALSRGAPRGLLVWPETAINLFQVQDLPGRPTISGVATFHHNQALAWNGKAVTSRYDKIKPVPFGESFPLIHTFPGIYRAVFAALGLPMLHSIEAGRRAVPLTLGGTLYGTYICYDSDFPWISRMMVRRGAEVLINISNDAWFGVGLGMQQEFAQGRLRAIEDDRYLLRDGNNGITALVGPRGRVDSELPIGVPGRLVVRYRKLRGITPYVRYGDLPVLAAVLLGILLLQLWPKGRLPADSAGR